jgi:hypothetical protein
MGMPIRLGLQAIVGSLNGSPILPTDHVTFRAEGSHYVLDVIQAGDGATGARRLWFDRGSLEVIRQEFFDAAGILTTTITYQDYRVVSSTATGPLMRPYLVRAENVRDQARLVLSFREIVPNPALTPQDWGIQPGLGEEN